MRSLLMFIAVVFLVSCGNGGTKCKNTKETIVSNKNMKSENTEEFRLKTATGKEFVVKAESKSASLNDIVVTPKGFEYSKENMVIKDADPIADVFTADINKDGFDELYVITRSAGSGSYATIYAWSSNRDKSVTPVYVKELSEKEKEKIFKGYMGHDSVYVSGDRLYRKFPVYKDGDANCCPSGGTKVVQYILKNGEASWILEVNND